MIAAGRIDAAAVAGGVSAVTGKLAGVINSAEVGTDGTSGVAAVAGAARTGAVAVGVAAVNGTLASVTNSAEAGTGGTSGVAADAVDSMQARVFARSARPAAS